ncbi:MAG: hypothetical protein JEY91_08275 [Spirochaetaceae bacterium]|nr:hypothetical protein [Spirochaetaceae bacterium]
MKKKLISFIFIFIISTMIHSQGYSPSEVVHLFGEHLNTIKDYQCRMYEWSIKGKKEEIRYINFYFLSPRLIRMDILKGNRAGDTGSIGVLREDGRVRGRKGGILSAIAVTVDREHGLATTIRGVTFDESDAIAAHERLLFLLDNSQIDLFEDPSGWLFECYLFEEDEGVTREVLFLDRLTMMPLFTKSYEKNKLVQFVQWDSYIINAGLPEELFHVRYKADKLNDLQITNNTNLPLDLRE